MVQVVEMSDKEKFKMYNKMKKKDIINMHIELEKHIPKPVPYVMPDESQVSVSKKGSRIYFSYPNPITSAEAEKLQGRVGYAPAGYGFYNFKTIFPEGVTWESASSCD